MSRERKVSQLEMLTRAIGAPIDFDERYIAWKHRADLTKPAGYRPVDERNARFLTRMREPEAGIQIIKAVHRAIDTLDKLCCILLIQKDLPGLNSNQIVDYGRTLYGGINLWLSKRLCRREQLPVEVMLFEYIPIDHANVSDAYADKRLEDIAAETAAAKDSHVLACKKRAFVFGKC